MAADVALALRAQAARTFLGLTPRRLAFVLLLIAGESVFSWPVAIRTFTDHAHSSILEYFVRTAIASATSLLPGLIAGLAVWNRAGARIWVRVALTVAAIFAVTWPAQRFGWEVQQPFVDIAYLRSAEDIEFNFVVRYLANAGAVVVLVAMLLYMALADTAAAALEREALRAIDAERGLAEARIQAMQAQIEPHFLFNTLANVRRLYRLDPPAARTMLRQFSAMLASSLSTMRDARSTLGKELALSRAYLAVQQIRMGERLTIEIEAADDLHCAELPPMMLPTLVENAIKHGLAPLTRGGAVRIAADATGHVLRVTVADSGRGLSECSGTGVGLANIERRLAALYGDAAALDLSQNDLGGATAVITLPLRYFASNAWPHEHAVA